jgi:hypothetical protein
MSLHAYIRNRSTCQYRSAPNAVERIEQEQEWIASLAIAGTVAQPLKRFRPNRIQ